MLSANYLIIAIGAIWMAWFYTAFFMWRIISNLKKQCAQQKITLLEEQITNIKIIGEEGITKKRADLMINQIYIKIAQLTIEVKDAKKQGKTRFIKPFTKDSNGIDSNGDINFNKIAKVKDDS